jgi:hypothetical protein
MVDVVVVEDCHGLLVRWTLGIEIRVLLSASYSNLRRLSIDRDLLLSVLCLGHHLIDCVACELVLVIFGGSSTPSSQLRLSWYLTHVDCHDNLLVCSFVQHESFILQALLMGRP